jgi:hypothetical protein
VLITVLVSLFVTIFNVQPRERVPARSLIIVSFNSSVLLLIFCFFIYTNFGTRILLRIFVLFNHATLVQTSERVTVGTLTRENGLDEPAEMRRWKIDFGDFSSERTAWNETIEIETD